MQYPLLEPRLAYERTGLAFSSGLTATEALERLGGFPVTSERIFTEHGVELSQRALMHDYKPLAIVSKQYQLIPPDETVQMWDQLVNMPVVGMSLLRNGRRLVFVTKLPSYEVRGDQLDNFLYIVNGFDGTSALYGGISPVRFYCTNQLPSITRSISRRHRYDNSKLRVLHRNLNGNDARKHIIEWLAQVQHQFIARSNQISALYTMLADKQLSERDLLSALNVTYPEPPKPASHDVVGTERWKMLYDQVVSYRMAVRELFEGSGTEMNRPAVHGNAFGFLNAVTEFEDRRAPERFSDKQLGQSVIFGPRAAVKERAFNAVMLD
jgi:hypothetical protein